MFWVRIAKEMFEPGLLGLIVNPFYFARKGLLQHISSLAPQLKGKVLDIGCGTKPYQKYFASNEYIGMEIGTKKNLKKNIADVYYDGDRFPFEENSFESSLCTEVFEHIYNPNKFLDEVYRILKPNGTLLMTVPFVWDEHGQPYDFSRYSSFGIILLLKKHGFEILELRKSINDIRIIFQLINLYIYKKRIKANKYIDLLQTIIVMGPLNILGSILGVILPQNDDLYLDNIILAKKRDIK